MSHNKTYLGDGVYADHNGYAITLITEDGYRATNTVVLEPEVYDALVQWAKRQAQTPEGET